MPEDGQNKYEKNPLPNNALYKEQRSKYAICCCLGKGKGRWKEEIEGEHEGREKGKTGIFRDEKGEKDGSEKWRDDRG